MHYYLLFYSEVRFFHCHLLNMYQEPETSTDPRGCCKSLEHRILKLGTTNKKFVIVHIAETKTPNTYQGIMITWLSISLDSHWWQRITFTHLQNPAYFMHSWHSMDTSLIIQIFWRGTVYLLLIFLMHFSKYFW